MSCENYTTHYLAAMKQAIEAAEATILNGTPVSLDAGFAMLCEMCHRLKPGGGTLFFAGNGASAMMSSHMAVDFCKNGSLRSMAFNDPAFLTAIGNDIGYSQVFELPLTAMGRPVDLLATISSSGNSPNILEAIKAARRQGMSVVTFSGMKPDNQSRKLGDVNFFVPAPTYGVVESIHAVLLHCWLDRFMNIREWENQ